MSRISNTGRQQLEVYCVFPPNFAALLSFSSMFNCPDTTWLLWLLCYCFQIIVLCHSCFQGNSSMNSVYISCSAAQDKQSKVTHISLRSLKKLKKKELKSERVLDGYSSQTLTHRWIVLFCELLAAQSTSRLQKSNQTSRCLFSFMLCAGLCFVKE